MTRTPVVPSSGRPASVSPLGRVPLLYVDRATAGDRQLALLVLGMGLPWMAYTHLYSWLHPRGLTVAPSLFMHLTGHPDPLCGLTRTFAWMWRGDLPHAMLAYPIGPAVFAASFPLLAYAGFILAGRRAIRGRLPVAARRAVFTTLLLVLAANWAAKLLWLGI